MRSRMPAHMNPLPELLGSAPALTAVREDLGRLLRQTTGSSRLPCILLLGETGTGKGLLARALHRASPRGAGAFVDVDCAAIPETLLEAELFGFERGAFTDARQAKPGLFQAAHGGTIFFDEVGDMSPEMQSRLLRVLQTGESKPVGDVVTRKVRVRVIAATNRLIEKALATGEFREDLFYRFNAFTITLPPLRDRTEDIPVLAHHFLRKAEAKVNKKVDRFAPEALDLLKRYPWPGNLRELENIIERAVVLATSRQIEVALLPLHLQENAPVSMRIGDSLLEVKERAVARVEREAIERFLGEARGNVSAAAKRAGTTRRNFHRLIVKYAIDMRSFRSETHKTQ